MLKRDDLTYDQISAIEALKERGQASLWAKPGSGKTVVGATAVVDQFTGPTLVAATKRICELVWRQEFDRWEHLQHLETVLLAGRPPKERDRLLSSTADFYLINYELLPWLADELKGSPWPFQSIVFDEVSKMKWPNTTRFKRLRKPVLSIPVRYGLTGSPRGNSLLGVWGQGYMTCATVNAKGVVQTPYAPTMGRFKARWFQPVDKERRIWRPLDRNTEPEIRKLSKPYAYSIDRQTAAPEARVVPVPVALPRDVRKLYSELEAKLEVNINGYDIEAVEPGVNRQKRLQILSGAIYTNPDRTHWTRTHDGKLDALDEIIEEMQGEPLLIFYRFRHELERIAERHKDLLTINDADKWLKNGGTIAVHPQSAAHGLNLHVGGCCASVWFTLPDSQELWEQGNRRLARKGQTRDVSAMVLAIQNTVEDNVARNLASLGRLQDELIDAATE